MVAVVRMGVDAYLSAVASSSAARHPAHSAAAVDRAARVFAGRVFVNGRRKLRISPKWITDSGDVDHGFR